MNSLLKLINDMTETNCHDSDEDLLLRMAGGDEESFVTLYRRRQASVYRFAFQMSGSSTVAEDVTQEVFMALIKDSSGFSASKGKLAGYIYGIARNHVLRRLEKDRNTVSIDGGIDDELASSSRVVEKSDPLSILARNETVENVRNAVLALPVHYREVVILCELNEMSYVETAAALNCAVGTVRSRLHRARAILVEKLGAQTDPKLSSNSANSERCFA